MTRERAIEVIRAEYNANRISPSSLRKPISIILSSVNSQEPKTEPKYCDRNICLSNEYNGIGCDECIVNKVEQEPCETCGYAEGSPFCLQYCPYDAERKKEQEPTVQEKQAESEKYQKAFDEGYDNGYAQARFDYEQEPCDDVIGCEDRLVDLANAIESDDSGYWTNKRISSALRKLPLVTQKSRKWNTFELSQGGIKETWYECPKCKWSNALLIPRNYCPNCGARMESEE